MASASILGKPIMQVPLLLLSFLLSIFLLVFLCFPLDTGEGCDQFIFALAVMPDGRLVSGGDDRTVRVWSPGLSVLSVLPVYLLFRNGETVTLFFPVHFHSFNVLFTFHSLTTST